MTIPEILSQKLHPRLVLRQIQGWLHDKRIIVLIGARQTGKTSVTYLIIQELAKSGWPTEQMLFFDLEDFEVLELCNRGPKEFVDYLQRLGVDREKRCYVFIDEIQYMDNPSNFLKLLVDHHHHLKLICTGSSSLDLKRKFRDYLVGRKTVFEISPLTFSEFLEFKSKPELVSLVREFTWQRLQLPQFDSQRSIPLILFNQLRRLLDEYVVYGGYPGVALEDANDRKERILQEIYQTYIYKDLNQLFTIANLTAFNNLVRLLALQMGNLVNYNELTLHLGISRPTLEKYIFILESTFVISIVTPFYSNKRLELVKMPKIYFIDTGMRNRAARNMKSLEERADAGALMENRVYRSLRNGFSSGEEIKFWRTKHGNEVDFVVEGQHPIPIEVKYQKMKRPQTPAGVRSFLANYPSSIAYVVTKELLADTTTGQQHLRFVPSYLLE